MWFKDPWYWAFAFPGVTQLGCLCFPRGPGNRSAYHTSAYCVPHTALGTFAAEEAPRQENRSPVRSTNAVGHLLCALQAERGPQERDPGLRGLRCRR